MSKKDLLILIVYNVDINYQKNIVNYQCSIIVKDTLIKNIGLNNVDFNDMIGKCTKAVFNYFKTSKNDYLSITYNAILLDKN